MNLGFVVTTDFLYNTTDKFNLVFVVPTFTMSPNGRYFSLIACRTQQIVLVIDILVRYTSWVINSWCSLSLWP